MSAVPKTMFRTVEQAATQLSCSPRMIYKLYREGRLELVKLGRTSRVTERSLNALVDEMLTGDVPSLQPYGWEDDERRS